MNDSKQQEEGKYPKLVAISTSIKKIKKERNTRDILCNNYHHDMF